MAANESFFPSSWIFFFKVQVAYRGRVDMDSGVKLKYSIHLDFQV